MTHPGQPATSTPPPYAPGVPAPDPVAAPAPSRAKKWLRIGGSVVVAGVVASSWAGFGASTPEVGDCVAAAGEASFDVVDCGGGDAEHRVVGIEPETMSYDDYMADDALCADHPSSQMVLWVGETGSDGTVLCAEPV